MKLVVAVSGGVDSVVLLDQLVRSGEHELIVAHFDHGIRPDSHEDAAFVRDLANMHKLPFETKREELGPDASEELARTRRYAFLREVAQMHKAMLATAHHANDVVETIAINLVRGTGWRGLAALGDKAIYRPLVHRTKAELLEYARTHKLEWREDSTNASDKYLRNRIRERTNKLVDDELWQLVALRDAQIDVSNQIYAELKKLISQTDQYDRYFFTQIPQGVALECLRYVTGARLTRPQLERALVAIKTMHPGKVYQAGSGVNLHFTTRHFRLEVLK